MRALIADSAEGGVGRTLEIARQRKERGHEALALWLLVKPPRGASHLGLGKLYRRTGERQEAQAHLTIATTMYCAMDMRFWLEQPEAELQALA